MFKILLMNLNEMNELFIKLKLRLYDSYLGKILRGWILFLYLFFYMLRLNEDLM